MKVCIYIFVKYFLTICRMLELAEMNSLRAQMKEMTQRHNTALQLIGEKEEQLEEFKADIADMKALYKSQISDLLEKIELLAKSQKNVQ